MGKSKSVFSSMTMQGLAVVLVGLVLSHFGQSASSESVQTFVGKCFELAPQVVEVVGIVVAALGRLRASHKLHA